MSPFVIPTKFTAVDQMSSQVRGMAHNVHNSFEQLNSGLDRQQRLFKRLTPGIGDATKQLLNYVGAGTLLVGAGASGKAVMDYETAIQSLSAVTGVGGAELENYKSIINDVADRTKKSATDIAGSYEVVGSAMSQYLTDPKALTQITEAGITLAKASRQELMPTLEQLTSIMNQFEIGADRAEETINRLTAGEIVGSLRTKDVAYHLQEFAAGAYAANISLTESVALTEALAKQMKSDKIGVGARNILTVMDSATGLSKKARKELKHAGVDTKFLMDKTKSLSERLHELAKLQGNSKAITKIFGHENKTAAQVIFNQLDTYDEYVRKIGQTNEAHNQAATNSKTLAVAIDELKNTWVNYLVSNDDTIDGLNQVKDAIHFVTENVDGIVSTVINVVKVFALWKATMLVTRGVIIANNVYLGIQNALYATSVGLLEENIAAQKIAIVTKRALGIATDVLSGNFATLNAVMLANPIGLVIAGVAALAAGMYILNEHNKEMIEQYKKKMALDTTQTIKEEAAEVQKLVEKYYMLGNSIKQSNALAIQERKLKNETERKKVEDDIAVLKAKLDSKKIKSMSGGGAVGQYLSNMMVSNSADADSLHANETRAAELAKQNNYDTQYAQAAVEKGVVDYKDISSVFAPTSKKETPAPAVNYMAGDGEKRGELINYEKLRQIFLNSQKVTVEFKNAPAGTSVNSGGVSTPNSY